MGFTDLPVVGTDEVHLTAVQVTGVPPGLTVTKTGVVSVAETSNGGPRHYIGALTEDMLSQGYPHLHIHPVSDAVLKPAGAPVDWYVVVVIAATQAGDFTTGGLHLSYVTAGGTSGDVRYPYHIRIHATP